MPSQVTNLKIASAPLLITREEFAKRLREVATNIESGEYGDITDQVLILKTTDGIRRISSGGQDLTNYKVIGLLEVAKQDIIFEMFEDA